MLSRSRPGPGPGEPRHLGPAWRRARAPLHVVVPLAVATGVGALLMVAGRSAVRPARPIEVVPAVYDRAAETPARDASRQAGAPAGPGVAVQAPGWLEADPFAIAATALADGVVEEVLRLEGESVERGDVVARLVSDDARLELERSEADLAIAQARALAARAEVDAATTDWENPVERDREVGVARAALAETEAELAQLPALISSEQATLDRLREEHARLLRASESGAATAIELVIAAKREAAQAASLEALVLREPILEAQRVRLRAEVQAAERGSDLRVAERRALDLARASLAMGEAEVRMAEARLAEARLRVDRMTIRAPISGLVQARLKAPGDKVMLGMDDPHSSHLLHIYDPSRLQVRVDVPLADASHISVGQRCEVVVEVLPDVTFVGEVTRITNEADLQKNTLEIKVRVIDPSPVLKPEMLTRVKFLPAGRSGGNGDAPAEPTVLVRADVVDGGAGVVWVVRDRRRDRGVVRAVPVEARGERVDGWVRVRGDVRPGDLLALRPDGLRDGSRVRMVPPKGEGGAS